MNHPALILIDIQRGFADLSWGQRNNPAFERNVARLLQHWRRHAWAIIHVRHNSTNPQSPLRPGQIGNDFMECASPISGERVVEKTVNSAFIGTNLQVSLETAGLKKLVFAGLTTDHCVSTTVRMAANLGFTASVLSDATATFLRADYEGQAIAAETVHRVSLASLEEEFAQVISTSNILEI